MSLVVLDADVENLLDAINSESCWTVVMSSRIGLEVDDMKNKQDGLARLPNSS